jgi:transcriptional regulator with XRE-family HTH domain
MRMPRSTVTAEHQCFLRRLGADIRALRERVDLKQEEFGGVLGFNRDAISNIERGINNMSVYEYLRLVQFVRADAPDHPALLLARRYGMFD